MSFIKCPNCGKQYSDKAENCPFCEESKQKDKNKLTHQLNSNNQISPATSITAIIVLVIIIAITAYNNGLITLPSNKNLQTISAKELYKQFNKNELSAAEKYSGKTFIITGEYCGNGISLGNPWILIGRGVVASDVQCFLDKTSVKKAARLKVGQKIKATGTVDQIMVYSVLVDDCKL